MPSLLSLDARVEGLLRQPGNPERVAAANAYLAALNGRAGTRVVYILDARGKVLATSNFQRPDSYLGEDLSFRPYFRSAIEGQLGRFYGVGTTRSEIWLLPLRAAGRPRQAGGRGGGQDRPGAAGEPLAGQ